MRVLVLVILAGVVLTGTCWAETHRFEPRQFYNTFSADHPPALRIKPGDHVVTYTIDAGGIDSKGVQRGRRPNPEIGPFYIEGAEPGDTLVVHLLRLETNRDRLFGFGARPTPLTRPFCAPRPCARRSAPWQIDKQKGIAFMDPVIFKGPRIELPLPHAGLHWYGSGQQSLYPDQLSGQFRRQHGLQRHGRRRHHDVAGF